MVPPERLADVVECIPAACGSCGSVLVGADPEPHLHQVAELPEVRPDVVEYRLHRLTCPRREKATRGALPPGIPAGAFGPRLLATVALLTGADRLGKRQVQAALADLLGLNISTGMVSKAERLATEVVATPVEEIAQAIPTAPAWNVDETGWPQAKLRAWLWTAVAERMTLFQVHRSRGADALRRLVGPEIAPVITSDRSSTHQVVPVRRTCWAHRRRDFPAMIDRNAGGERVGARLLYFSGLVISLVASARGWADSADDAATRCELAEAGGPTPAGVGPRWALSVDGEGVSPVAAGPKVAVEISCVAGVSPDDNAAGRALRHGVIWRRTSGGTDSQRGRQFVGRLLSVGSTCRQRGRHVLGFLSDCFRSRFLGRPAPSLLA